MGLLLHPVNLDVCLPANESPYVTEPSLTLPYPAAGNCYIPPAQMSFQPSSALSPLWSSLFNPHGNGGCSRAAIIAAITAREDSNSSRRDGVSRAVILDELGDVSEPVLDIALKSAVKYTRLKSAVKYGKLIKIGDSYKVVTAEECRREKEANRGPQPFTTKGQSMFASTKNISAYTPVCEPASHLDSTPGIVGIHILPPVPVARLLSSMPC